MWWQWHELRKSQILALTLTFSALGCGVPVRQPLRWCSSIWEQRIYTTNCSIILEEVLVCQVIHRVYLRVSNSRSIHQISTGSERAIIAYWVNNHHGLIHAPRERDFPAVSLSTLVPGQHPGALTKPHVLLLLQAGSLAQPFQALSYLGQNLHWWFHGQPAAPSHHGTFRCRLPWAEDS